VAGGINKAIYSINI